MSIDIVTSVGVDEKEPNEEQIMNTPFRVGGRYVAVWSHNRADVDDVEVTKVGRKWVHFEVVYRGKKSGIPFKCSPQGVIHGGKYASLGRLHLSLEHYANELATQRAWVEFQREVARMYACPQSLSLSQVQNLVRQAKCWSESARNN